MSYKNPRPYLNGTARPQMYPRGSKPRPTRRSTKHKHVEYGEFLKAKSDAKHARRMALLGLLD